MKKLSVISVVLAVMVVASLSGCGSRPSESIHYPEPAPTDSVVSFLPGVVCSGGDSIDFNATFSPDGRSFYFTRSQNRKWEIYVSHYAGGQWTKAVKTGIGDDGYSEADPMFGPDGALYFISDRPREAADTLPDFDIWYVKPLGDGMWSQPQNVTAVNTDSTEYYVSFAGNGNMYFASSRPGGYGQEDIYVSRLVNGRYSKPENLGPRINSVYSDHDPCLPKNERFMIYTSVERKDGYGEGDLYLAIKDNNGQWTTGKNMGPRFNTPTYEYCSYFSPDHQYFFYSSQLDVKWTSVEILPEEVVSMMR